MAYLGQFLSERGYMIRYQHDSQNQLRSLIFTHPASITKTRRFLEVVIIDATYKTNIYKIPYVNIVGIDAVGRKQLKTFAIAGAWISDEKAESHTWIARHLNAIIWKPVCKIPGVFTMDFAAAAVNAFEFVFPECKLLLCAVHILDDFTKNYRKAFDVEEQ